MNTEVYDYVVIGSGFGGAVSAFRLSQKGYRVLILEQGKKWRAEDFPKSNWNIKKYLWAPLLRSFGIQRISIFNEAFILSGVGYGGGSLVYGNTHMTPSKEFFQNPIWAKLGAWEEILAPHYQMAKKMLGTTQNPHLEIEDEALKTVAEKWGRGASFSPLDVGVYFGDPLQEKDPYFSGEGPLRKGCNFCSGCMVGCPNGAKNTLDKNYLYFAEKSGAEVRTGVRVEKIEFENDEYILSCHPTEDLFKSFKIKIRTRGVVLAAGVLGSLEILFKQKWKYKTLTKLSDKLGENFRTNSESLCGVAGAQKKLNNGVAISSVIHPDNNTHIQICKYPDGSGLMGRMAVMSAEDGGILKRILQSTLKIFTQPISFLRVFFDFEFASRSVFLLVMQNLDNSMKMIFKKNLFGWSMKMQNDSGHARVPSYVSTGQRVMNDYAKVVGGVPLNAFTEVFFNLSSTAHALGGCPMGASVEEGVVDSQFNVFGYPRFFITDGSIIPCNLGVNPSLTITALSEYAMSLVQEKK